MAGSHMAQTQKPASNSKWKVILLVVILLVVIAALFVLLWQLFGAQIKDKLGIGGGGTAEVAPGVVTEVKAEYGNGRNVAGNISVSPGTQRPEDIPADADVILLDINWTSKKEMSEPLYITVSDPSFTDGDGLAVYHCGSDGQWELIGTYVIANNSVTFLADSLSPFAFQVISSEPEPVATPEASATPEPTASPEPTPEPTPAPINAVDYGAYPAVQTGVFTMVNEIEDDTAYVMALVDELPDNALATPEDETEDEEEEDGDVTLSYVDAPDAASVDAAVTEGGTVAEQAAVAAPTASVLVNLDGTNLGLIDMELKQTEEGVWYLAGPVTEGMLWTSNRDAYKNERRYSLENNDSYLNLDDNDENVILNDNHVRTRWLIESAKRATGTEIATLTYRNDSRFYVNQLAMVDETLPGGGAVVAATPAPDGTTPQTASNAPVYLGTTAPADTSAVRQYLRFSVTKEEGQALQLVLFKLDQDMTAPEDVATTMEHSITVPAITEETNLSSLVIQDGAKTLTLGVDYTISARVYNDSVVVIISFMGDYTGQIVRTFPGTTFVVDGTVVTTPTPMPSASPVPSPSPTPYTGGEGSNAPPSTGGTTGGNTGTTGGNTGTTGGNTGGTTATDPPTVTTPPASDPPPATGTNTEPVTPEPVGDPSDTNA